MILGTSVERDMLDKKEMMKFFSWWSVAHFVLEARVLLLDLAATISAACDWPIIPAM